MPLNQIALVDAAQDPTPEYGWVPVADGSGGYVWQESPGSGAVASVNGQEGTVNLTASDVGADPAGSASAAQSAAETAATTNLAAEVTRAEAAEASKASATALTAETSRAETAEALALQKASNLSDLASAATARTNLGLGSAAIQPSSAFDAAGAAAWAPADSGFLAWNFDPLQISSSLVATAGYQIVVAIKIPRAMTVANLIMNVNVIGATLTTGQNIASIYSPTGTLIASTADQSTVWTSLGLKVMALTAAGGQSLLLPAGYVLAGPLAKGTTAPQFSDAAVSAAAAVALNANLTSPLLRSGYAGSGTYTAPPSTLPTVTGQGGTMWAALS